VPAVGAIDWPPGLSFMNTPLPSRRFGLVAALKRLPPGIYVGRALMADGLQWVAVRCGEQNALQIIDQAPTLRRLICTLDQSAVVKPGELVDKTPPNDAQ
jgi:hypothetical protein